MYKVTFKSRREVWGILADSEDSAIRAARWLHPNEQILEVSKC